MNIFNEFEVLEPYPAIYIKSINAVVISDLYLGLVELLTDSDVLFPKFQLTEIKENLEIIFSEKKPRMLIITGDIKNEFSKITWLEQKELLDFLDFLSETLKEIIILKGNHDNYFLSIISHYPKIQLKPELVIKKMCFIQGNQKNLDISKFNVDYFIIGNEHVIISSKNKSDMQEKIPCFLYGELISGEKLMILPTFSKLSRNITMNLMSQKDLLDPLLRKSLYLNKLNVVGLSKELGLMELGRLGKLRQIS